VNILDVVLGDGVLQPTQTPCPSGYASNAGLGASRQKSVRPTHIKQVLLKR